MSNEYLRNLPVSYFSQRDNTFVWQAKGNAAGIKYNGKVYYKKRENVSSIFSHFVCYI